MGQTNFKFLSSAPEDQFRKTRSAGSGFGQLVALRDDLLHQEAFHSMLTLERRRAERSKNPFVLLLINSHSVHKNGNRNMFIGQLTSAVSGSIRETDIIGWYEYGEILGVIFTETNLLEDGSVAEVLSSKITSALQDAMGHGIASKLVISVHVFPQNRDKNGDGQPNDVELYSDLSDKSTRKHVPIVLKRAIDILGSGLLLLILSPVLAAVALLIKLTSQGPVVFEQERLGQFGRRFKCLKFRSMYANNDAKIHREYVQSFIAGKADGQQKSQAGYSRLQDHERSPYYTDRSLYSQNEPG